MKAIRLYLYYFIILFLLQQALYSQAIKEIKIRSIDQANFQKIKLYLDVFDKEDNLITNLDSAKIFVLEKETGEKSTPSSSLFYNSSEGMLICFVIDASPSMNGAPLNNCKQGLIKALKDFRPVDKMGIAVFNDDFYKKSEFGNDREVLKNNINDLRTGGRYSLIYKSVIKSLEWLNSFPTPKRKVLIVISDGADNGREYTLDDCINQIKESDISVYTIASTRELNENRLSLVNMRKLSDASPDGWYFRINTPDDIGNIIPAIYDRVKQEYILEYYSYAEPNTAINGTVKINHGNTDYEKEFRYTAPGKIIENHPSKSFWKTTEFLFGSVGVVIVIAGLTAAVVVNNKKKKRIKTERDIESKLREQESRESKDRYSSLMDEYNQMLDKLEKQSMISRSDKEKIDFLEKNIAEAARKSPEENKPKVDIRRRTMIFSSMGTKSAGSSVKQAEGIVSIVSGQEKGKKLAVPQDGLVIGRNEGGLIIPDNTVSRRHARIFRNGNDYFIEDLGSTNGTFVNNQKVSNSVIKSGDFIKVGDVQLTFS